MSEKSSPEIVLEYIKVFIWPFLAVGAVLWLGGDLKEILETRTVKIGVLEIGNRISGLDSTLQNTLVVQKDNLNKIIALSNNEDVKKYAQLNIDSIESTQKGIKKDIQTIQGALPQPSASTSEKNDPVPTETQVGNKPPTTAAGWEAQGFDYLLKRDILPALDAFTQAEKVWPDYHNVSEIKGLLIQNQAALQSKSSEKWKEIYQEILSKYSWGMPSSARLGMQSQL